MVYVTPKRHFFEWSFGQSVTSLAGVTPQLVLVRLELPFERSFRDSFQLDRLRGQERGREVAISGDRSKKRPLTRQNKFSPLGYVSDWTDWLALSRFVWLSYSQSAIFGRPPGLMIPVPSLARSKAPHASLVEQALREFHPARCMKACCGLNPQDGITPACRPHPLKPSRPLP